MRYRCFFNKRTEFFQFLYYKRIAFIVRSALKLGNLICPASFGIKRRESFYTVLLADFPVFKTMPRGSVYGTRTCFKRNMLACQNGRKSVIHRMFCLKIFKFKAAKSFPLERNIFPFNIINKTFKQFFCNNIVFAAVFKNLIFKIRVQAYCHIGRNCPRSCCPDDAVERFFLVKSGHFVYFLRILIDKLKLHINRF